MGLGSRRGVGPIRDFALSAPDVNALGKPGRKPAARRMMARFAMNLKREMPKILRVIALLMVLGGALLFGNCGNGLPHSSDVTAKVTPAQATVAVSGVLELEGNASGFTVSPILAWRVQEGHDAGGDDCGYLKLPPASPSVRICVACIGHPASKSGGLLRIPGAGDAPCHL